MKSPRPATHVRWWGRLESRVIAALVVLGVLCVGASAYLVQLTAGYFDLQLRDAMHEARTTASEVEPFHRELVAAKVDAFEARAAALAMALALRRGDRDGTFDRAWLSEVLEREGDIERLELSSPGATAVAVERSVPTDRDPTERSTYVARAKLAATSSESEQSLLQVTFSIDPAIDARYQAVGERMREIARRQSTLESSERALFRVIGIGSAVLLVLSVLAGLVLARATTRKVGALSRTMAAVAGGDLQVRARVRGRDELAQLGQAFNRMLDELERARERVAYLQRIGAWQDMARRLAHEIKNPLTPIQLAVQQIRDKDPGGDAEFSALVRASVEIVEDEIAGLRTMVQTFSQFAKVPEVQLAVVDLRAVVDEFVRAYGHLTDREGDRLHVRVEAGDFSVRADRQLFKQALVNLVENAVLSARELGATPVEVQIVVIRHDLEIEVRVEDNGPGIALEKRQLVFEPYYTSRRGGTGLGLAIVKKIVLDHGGTVHVEDAASGGAALCIRLPLPRATATHTA